MSRNSILPLVLLVLITAGAFWMVRGAAARGQDGPENQQGIFRLPAKESRRIQPAAVSATTTLTGTLPSLGEGLVVQIVGGDRHGLTRTVTRSLAELLTERGLIAVLEPQALPGKETEPVPLPADGGLRITTDQVDPPAAPGLAYRAVITITAVPVRLPEGHPARRLLPRDVGAAEAPATATLTIEVAPLADAAWPTWWAGVGRQAAVSIVAATRLPESGDIAAHTRRGAWLAPVQASGPGAAPALVTEHGRLPSPPQTDVAVDLIPFSHPLVRGWVGRLSPLALPTRDGGTRTAEQALEKRLTKGQWIPGPAVEARRTFTREVEGLTTALTIEQDGTLVIWQERPSPATVVQGWLADPAAKAQLERHRGIPGLPTGMIP